MSGQSWAPILTIGFVLFNIIFAILLTGIEKEGISSGASSKYTAAGVNQSADSTVTTYSSFSFLHNFGIGINGAPWWLTPILITMQTLFISIIILCWVRGL